MKQVTFGLSCHIGCPVVWAYVRSRGNQKFTPDFLTHSAPDARLLLMTVINYWTNLSKYCDLSMVSISILLEMPKAGANDWSERQWKITVSKEGLFLPGNGTTFSTVLCFFQKISLDRPMFHIRCKWTFWKRFENGKKPWDDQYYSKTSYLCSKTIQSFSSSYVIGSYLQVTQWYLDQSRIWKKTIWMIMENIRC